MLTEFNLIERFFNRQQASGQLTLGIGDDAAVIAPDPGAELVVATDAIVNGIHFPVYTPPHAIGYRSLAVNLSDLAAMGAVPRWASLALCLPDADTEWLEQFADGFFDLADIFNVSLIGGDTVSGPLMASVTVHGEVGKGMAVTRSGANEGDGIYVTGHPGDAVAGRLVEGTNDADHYLADRFLYPVPRVMEGQALRNVASAMIDISDGLHADLGHVLNQSGLGAELDVAALPLSNELRSSVGREQAQAMALTGGDDYELCFTVPDEHQSQLQELVDSFDCAVTRIGTCVATEESEAVWRLGQNIYQVPDSGFEHFSDEGQEEAL